MGGSHPTIGSNLPNRIRHRIHHRSHRGIHGHRIRGIRGIRGIHVHRIHRILGRVLGTRVRRFDLDGMLPG